MLPQIPNFKCKSFLHNFYNSLLNAYYSSFIIGAVLEVVFAHTILLSLYSFTSTKAIPFVFKCLCSINSTVWRVFEHFVHLFFMEITFTENQTFYKNVLLMLSQISDLLINTNGGI